MFTKYEIKKIENEEVLIIHMDYNFEFAEKLGKIENDKTLMNQVKKYMKKMKINFHGKYIILMIAGIAVVTFLYNSPELNGKVHSSTLNPLFYSTLNYKKDQSNLTLKSNTSDNTISTEKTPTPDSSISQTKPDISESKPDVSKPTDTNPTPPTSTARPNQPESKPVQKPTEDIPQSPSSESKPNIPENKPAENETYVTLYRSNGTVQTILLEEYVIGVVGSEMPASFHIEALRAQAIIARTYALKRINEGKVLTDTTSNQVYKDNNQLKSLWGNSFNTYYNKVKQAVDSTKGMVITYNNKVIDAVYHSTSNGYTVDAKDVWGNNIPYLKSVSSIYDTTATSFLRQTIKQVQEISKTLGITMNENSVIEIISRNSNNQVIQIKIDETIYSGVDFRNKLGLRSTDFDIMIDGTSITFTTRGYGHGVGMSQYGANGMANNGYTYNQIINHYYTNVKIVKK